MNTGPTVNAICPPNLHPIACLQNPSLLIPETELDNLDYRHLEYKINWWFIGIAIAAIYNREIKKGLGIGYQIAKPIAIEGYNKASTYIKEKYSPPPPPIWPTLSPARQFRIGQYIKDQYPNDPDISYKVDIIAEKELQRDPQAYDSVLDRKRNPKRRKKK